MTKSINHQFFFPHSPQAVWEYLTNPELMELWLMKSNFQPVMGHDFQFRTKPVPDLNFDGVCHCKVLEIVPFKRLSYSWKCGPGDGTLNIDSVVIWKLQPKDKGTELFLEHSNFAIMENLGLFNAMNEGWLKNIHKIAERLNNAQHGTTNA
jgi:uncharacterized protein YndB with AHSA1/START domain